jgi:hypothetical protein
VKEGNLAGVIYERLRGVYGDVCRVPAVSADQPRCGPPRTVATGRNKQKVDELIRKDRRITFREISAQLGVGRHAVQEMMEILG